MKKNCLFILMAGIILFMQSCKIMYVPNTQNVPMFKEKNEVRATLSTSNLQAAYSVASNAGIMVNAQFRDRDWSHTINSTKYDYETKTNLIELGAGYFLPIQDKGVFEIYGGAGTGRSAFNYSHADTMGGPSIVRNRYSARTTRFFLQPAIGFSMDNVDVVFSTRFLGLQFSDVDTTGYNPNTLFDNDLTDLDKSLYTFMEPAVTLRVGWKYVKFHAQSILSVKTNTAPLNYIPLTFNFGISVHFAPRFAGAAPSNP